MCFCNHAGTVQTTIFTTRKIPRVGECCFALTNHRNTPPHHGLLQYTVFRMYCCCVPITTILLYEPVYTYVYTRIIYFVNKSERWLIGTPFYSIHACPVSMNHPRTSVPFSSPHPTASSLSSAVERGLRAVTRGIRVAETLKADIV